MIPSSILMLIKQHFSTKILVTECSHLPVDLRGAGSAQFYLKGSSLPRSAALGPLCVRQRKLKTESCFSCMWKQLKI